MKHLGLGRWIVLSGSKRNKRYEDAEWIDLTEDKEKWLAVLNVERNLQGSTKDGEFLD